jgi:hypothetical protein
MTKVDYEAAGSPADDGWQVIDHSPKGFLQFHYHGNYGGPGWTAGSYGGRDYRVPPKGKLDALWREHDFLMTHVPREIADGHLAKRLREFVQTSDDPMEILVALPAAAYFWFSGVEVDVDFQFPPVVPSVEPEPPPYDFTPL